MMTERRLTGRVPRDAIKRLEIPRLEDGLLDRVRALSDLTGTLSDAMDDLGLFAAIPASTLRPTIPGARLIGQATTVRNVERSDTVTVAARAKNGRMGEHEAYNLSAPGDVVVIEGLTGVSNMGGQSVTLAHRSGCAGAIIDGSHRDPQASVALGFPIWSVGLTPITGKWRLQTIEINGRVRVAGIMVDAGDLVAADDAGIVFVPYERVAEVLARAEEIDAGDKRQQRDIATGIGLKDLAETKYK